MAVKFKNSININDQYTLPSTVGLTNQYLKVNDAATGELVFADLSQPTQVSTIAYEVRNETGASIPKGSVVYISGGSGSSDHVTITLSSASSEATSSKTFGITAETIANNSTGDVVLEGLIEGLDTSAFTSGSTLWLGDTPGSIQGYPPPSTPSHAVFVGYAVRVQQNNGSLFVKIQNGYELEELHDVLINSASEGDLLAYDATNGYWKNISAEDAIQASLTIEKNEFVGDGVEVDFTIDSAVIAESRTQVYIDGVYQSKSNYSTSSQIITFSEAPADGANIEVIHITTLSANITVDNFTADGTQSQYELSNAISAENNIQVYFDGVYQSKSNFSVSGSIITFSENVANGVDIEVVHLQPSVSQNIAFSGQVILYGGIADTYGGSGDPGQILSSSVLGIEWIDAPDLDGEIANRIAADSILQSNIDSEGTARVAADTVLQDNIDAEELVRSSADATLQGNINAEAVIRGNNDATLQSNIDAEELSRISGDSTLQSNINTEAQSRASADATLQSNIDAINAKDIVLTINGDASGSTTFTNLSDAILTLAIADDSHNHIISNIDGLQSALDLKANITYVDTAVANVVNSAPATLDTLNELAAALGDDPNFATTITNLISGKQAAGTYNTIIGTDSDINTSGATIVDNIYVTDGVITSMGTRTLTLGDLGYTGATNANYITNNNQLTNGAGYITSFDITTQTDSKYLRSDANDTATGKYIFSQTASTIGGSNLNNATILVGSTSSGIGIDNNEIHGSGATYIGTNSGDLVFRPSGLTLSQSNIHAPAFYDSDNTGYYLNPASTSLMNRLELNGNLDMRGQVSTWIASNVMGDAIGWNNSYGVYIGSNIGGTHYLRGNGTFTTGGNTYNLWHSGNDGSGSGLDADLLDGLQGSQFLRSDIGGAISGNLTVGSGASSYIYMLDSDHGTRAIHNNSNRIGFLTSASGWGSYCNDNGDWVTDFISYAGASMRAPIFYDSNNTGYYLNPASTSNLNALTTQGQSDFRSKRHNFGLSSGWDAIGFGNATNLHMNGHNQFWIGAGNGTWFTGTANSKSQVSGLAADAGYAHDLLLSTMQSTSTASRGITFGVDNSGSGTSGWRLGKWHSGDAKDSSKLVVDGGLFVKGGYTDEYDYYADDYSTYYSTQGGGGFWNGGTNNPSATFSTAIQIQSGNKDSNTRNPQIQFHQYGYGGVQFRYDGPNDRMFLEPIGSNRLDWTRLQTDSGYIDFGPANTGHAHIYTDRANFYFNKQLTVSGGSQINSGDIRSAIFYDSDNTGYYLNPSGTGDSIRVAGDIVAYYSDERLKDIKGNIENAVDKVKQLNGFYYSANETAQKLGYKVKDEVGVSAQEVEKVLPEIIKEAPIGQGYKTLDYSKIVPLLIEAIKEQQTQIDELKQLINKQ